MKGRRLHRRQVQFGHLQCGNAETGHRRRPANRREPQLGTFDQLQPRGEFSCDYGPFGAGIDEESERAFATDHDLHRHPPRRIKVKRLNKRDDLAGRAGFDKDVGRIAVRWNGDGGRRGGSLAGADQHRRGE